MNISYNENFFLNLEKKAAKHYKIFYESLQKARSICNLRDGEILDFDDENFKFRRVKLPDMEWLPFEEANEELS